MRIDPAIAALRSDRAPQRQAQTAMDAACRAWRSEPGAQGAVDDLRAYADGAALADCPHLSAMLRDPCTGRRLVERLFAMLARTMRQEIFAHPPFRHGFNGDAGTLMLAKCGRAQLLVQTREPGWADQSAAMFSDAERHDLVLAGTASARLVRLRGVADDVADLEEGDIDLVPDTSLSLDLARECLLVGGTARRLVVLRLVRTAQRPAPACEYARPGGRLLHRAAGSLADSHREAMISLLGRMQRSDAAGVVADIARADGPDSLRWHALRESLAMDTASGFAALVAIARDPADPIAADAGALRAQLVEAHPELLEWETARCPA